MVLTKGEFAKEDLAVEEVTESDENPILPSDDEETCLEMLSVATQKDVQLEVRVGLDMCHYSKDISILCQLAICLATTCQLVAQVSQAAQAK